MNNNWKILEIIQNEIDVIKCEYDDILNPFNVDKNTKKIETEKVKKVKRLLALYNAKNEELMKIKDDTTRLIIRYTLNNYSLQEIADRMNYSKSAIKYKIDKYKRGQDGNSK